MGQSYKRLMKILIVLTMLLALKVQSAQLPPSLMAKFLTVTSPSEIRFKDHWSVVFFLQTSCPYSHSHMEHLKELALKYPEIKFIGVHADGHTSSTEAKAYFEAFNLPFKIVDDSEFKWTESFKAMKTPQTFLISPQGEVVYEGAISNSANFKDASTFYLSELLAAIKSNKEIPYSHKRSLGCYITREKKS